MIFNNLKKMAGALVISLLAATAIAAVPQHGSIMGKDVPLYDQGPVGGNTASTLKDATLDYMLVTHAGKTYGHLQFYGTAGLDLGAGWCTQLRYWNDANGKTEINEATTISTTTKAGSFIATNTIPNPLRVSFFQNLNPGGYSETVVFDYDIAAKNSIVDGDNVAPVVSDAEASNVTTTTATLSITGSDDNGAVYYYVEDAANGFATFVLSATHALTGLLPSTDYNLMVTPIDFSGNEGTPYYVEFTTLDAPDADASTIGSLQVQGAAMYDNGNVGNPEKLKPGVTVDYKVVTLGDNTWAWTKLSGATAAIGNASYSSQLRFWNSSDGGVIEIDLTNRGAESTTTGSIAESVKVSNKNGQPYAGGKVSIFQDYGNFVDSEKTPYDAAQANSAVAGDNTAPLLADPECSEYGKDFAILDFEATDDNDFFYLIEGNGILDIVFTNRTTLTGLVTGKVYNIKVRAIDFSGNVSEQKTVTFTPMIPPIAVGSTVQKGVKLYYQGTSGGNTSLQSATDSVGAPTLDLKVVTIGDSTWAYTKLNGNNALFMTDGASLLRFWDKSGSTKKENQLQQRFGGNKESWGTINVESTRRPDKDGKVSMYQRLDSKADVETELYAYNPKIHNVKNMADVTAPVFAKCTTNFVGSTFAKLDFEASDDSNDYFYVISGDIDAVVFTDNFELKGLKPETSYSLMVKVMDFSGNESAEQPLTFTTSSLVQITSGVAKEIKFVLKSNNDTLEYYYEFVDSNKGFRDAFIKVTPAGLTELPEWKPTISPDRKYAYGKVVSEVARNIAGRTLYLNCGYLVYTEMPDGNVDWENYITTNTEITDGALSSNPIVHTMGAGVAVPESEKPMLTGVQVDEVSSEYAVLNIQGSDNSGVVYYEISNGEGVVNLFRTGKNYYSIESGKVYNLSVVAKDLSGNASEVIQLTIKSIKQQSQLIDGDLLAYNGTAGAAKELEAKIAFDANAKTFTIGCTTANTNLGNNNQKFYNPTVKIDGTSYPLILGADSTSASFTFENVIGEKAIERGAELLVQLSVFWKSSDGNFFTGEYKHVMGLNGEADTEAPSVPVLFLSGSALTWEPSVDFHSGVLKYEVQEEGQAKATIYDLGETSFTYTMADSSKDVTVTAIDMLGNASVAAILPNYTLTLEVKLTNGNLLSSSNVPVKANHVKGESSTTTANGTATFTIRKCSNVQVTLTQVANYVIAPETISITSLQKDSTINVTATPLYNVNVKVKDVAGNLLTSPTFNVAASGGITKVTTTSAGVGQFSNVLEGSKITLKVTPAAGYVMAADSMVIDSLHSDSTVWFTALALRSVTVQMFDLNDAVLTSPNFSVAVAGDVQEALTTASGTASFSVNELDSVVLHVTAVKYYVTPQYVTLKNLVTDTIVKFVAQQALTITVQVKDTTGMLLTSPDFSIACTGDLTDNATTIDGSTHFEVLDYSSVTLTTAEAGYDITPSQISLTSLLNDTTVVFTAVLRSHAVTVVVKDENGNMLTSSNFTVAASGGLTDSKTTSNGVAVFSNVSELSQPITFTVANADYVITPTLIELSEVLNDTTIVFTAVKVFTGVRHNTSSLKAYIAHGSLYVSTEVATVAITNMAGTLIMTSRVDGQTVNVAHLPRGIYFVQLKANNGSYRVVKVLKH